jgi:MFS transporter, DHA1 family, inner membrane transport protein
MYRRLLMLSLAAFAVGTDSFVIAGVLPDVSASLHVGTAAAGQLITAYALAYALLSPVMAAATAHWPRRTVLLVGLAVFIAGTAGSALLPAYPAVLAARAVAGLGGAMIVPVSGGVAAGLVPAAQRGRALAVVLAGLTAATALGAPLGTALAALTSWRVTMLGVAALGLLAAAGVATLLPPVPTPPAVGLRARLAPVRNPRVSATLATTLLGYAGLFTVYSYIALVFHGATGGNGRTLATLLLVWGLAATAGNLGAGHLVDRLGSHTVIPVALVVALLDFATLRWTSGTLPGALAALVVWGLSGWGLLVAQQHRLVSTAPAAAPILIGLNSSAVYLAVSASGLIGAAVISVLGAGWLGSVGAGFLAAALLATALPIRSGRGARPDRDRAAAEAGTATPAGAGVL